MRFLFGTSTVGRKSFGIGAATLGPANALKSLGHDVNILSSDRESDINEILSGYSLQRNQFFNSDIIGPKSLSFSKQAIKFHYESIVLGSADVYIQGNPWSLYSTYSDLWKKRWKKPLVTMPHGALQPWCLSSKSLKKRLALLTYEGFHLKNTDAFIALSEEEVSSIRDLSLKQPIALLRNGIPENWITATTGSNHFRNKMGIVEDKKIILFLSRVTEKKNVIGLIHGFINSGLHKQNYVLIIAGAGENEYIVNCQELVSRENLEAYILFHGMISGYTKESAFEASDLFILPSFSEGSPIAVLEALGKGVPVIVSDCIPHTDILSKKAGWVITPEIDSIKQGLLDATASTRDEHASRKLAAKQLAMERYTWKSVAEDYVLLAKWLNDEIDKPDFVILD